MKPLIKRVMNYYSILSFAFRKTDKVNIYVYPKNGTEKNNISKYNTVAIHCNVSECIIQSFTAIFTA